jgi:hypothetical protein
MDPDDRGPLRHHISMSLRGSPPDHNVSGRTIVVHRGPDSWRPGRCKFESRRVHLCRFMTGVCHWRLVDLVVDDHVWYRFESQKRTIDSTVRAGRGMHALRLAYVDFTIYARVPSPFRSFHLNLYAVINLERALCFRAGGDQKINKSKRPSWQLNISTTRKLFIKKARRAARTAKIKRRECRSQRRSTLCPIHTLYT